MIPIPEVQLVAFDLDGVVADTEPLHKASKERMLRRFGVIGPGEEIDVRRCVGFTNAQYWEEMRALHPGIPGTLDELEDAQLQGILDLIAERRLPPSEGLLPLLRALSARGVRIGLYSSSNRFYIDRVLEGYGLAHFFAAVVGGNEVRRRKPFPDGYLKVAELAGVPPERAVAVEDSAAGVDAAKAAGMRAVGYRNPTSGDQDLSRADWVTERLGDLL